MQGMYAYRVSVRYPGMHKMLRARFVVVASSFESALGLAKRHKSYEVEKIEEVGEVVVREVPGA